MAALHSVEISAFFCHSGFKYVKSIFEILEVLKKAIFCNFGDSDFDLFGQFQPSKSAIYAKNSRFRARKCV